MGSGYAYTTVIASTDFLITWLQVNTISPGVFESSMTKRLSAKVRKSLGQELVFPRRFGIGKEFAETVRWMLECGYVNGETVRVSGAVRLPSRL